MKLSLNYPFYPFLPGALDSTVFMCGAQRVNRRSELVQGGAIEGLILAVAVIKLTPKAHET